MSDASHQRHRCLGALLRAQPHDLVELMCQLPSTRRDDLDWTRPVLNKRSDMDMDHPHRAAQVSRETPDPSPRGRLDSEVSYQLVDHLHNRQ